MEQRGLLSVEKIIICKEFLEGIYREFQDTGKKGFERLALWAGDKLDNNFTVTHILYPRQYLQKGPDGMAFLVDGEELERIGEWLYENQKSLIAQIHSHPGKAYHSEADDELCIVTTTGGFSIVVPDFGNSDHYLMNSAFYRLMPKKGWTQLSKKEIDILLQIID